MSVHQSVMTMSGPRDAATLGLTLMHEHIFVRSTETTENYSTTWGSDDQRVEDAVSKLCDAADAGVDTLVDLTVLGIGRDIALMARVAERSPVSIVAATGSYVLDRLPYHFRFNPPRRNGDIAGGLADWLIRDLTVGIAGTGIRAGVIKCATDSAGVTDDVRISVRAAAIAANETGALIMTHADAETKQGYAQRDILRSEGTDLSRVVIGHVGDSSDLNYHRALMDDGMSIGLDRFGLGLSTEERVAAIIQLCSEGYADRMVLSHDAACHSEWIDQGAPGMEQWNFLHVPRDVIPMLRDHGIPETDISQLTVDNPRRLLGIATDTRGVAA